MDHAKPQLVIRIKTANCNLPPPPKTTYIYFWGRIFAALAAMLLLLGLVAYGIYLLLQSETPPESVNGVGSNPETYTVSEQKRPPEPQEIREDAALEMPLRKLPVENERITNVLDSPIASLPAASAVGTPSRQSEDSDTDLSAQLPKQPEPTPIVETDTDLDQVEQGLRSLPAESGAERTQKERKQSAPDIAIAKHSAPATKIAGAAGGPSTDIEKDETVAVAPENAIRQALFRLRGISLVSESVSRFVLAKSVVNNKPVGDIDDIAPDARGIAAVYAFSDVVGMKDEVLYYHWIHNGKQVAKLRVGVWANRWRSHSSKIINKKMKGEWRVELRNAKREMLASASFVY